MAAAVKQEFHLEEDKYYTEDEYVEEEEEEEEEEDEDSSVEKGSKKKGRGRAGGEPRMKMRRIFRITHGRERQRGQGRKTDVQINTNHWNKPFRGFYTETEISSCATS